MHVAAFYLDRVLLKAHNGASGRCLVPKHLWQLVAMVCLRLAGKFEEREEDVTGDASATLVLADGRRVSAVEAFTRHLGDAAMAVTSAQVEFSSPYFQIEVSISGREKSSFRVSLKPDAHFSPALFVYSNFRSGNGKSSFSNSWAGTSQQ